MRSGRRAGDAPLAAACPAVWWRVALAGAAGSSAGGLVSYGLGRAVPVRPWLARLPLVRPAMAEAAAGWLADEGARGLRHQPFSGVPFKVFALLAGACAVPLVPFLLWAFLARGARFAAVCGAAALLGRRASCPVRRHPWPLLAVWGVTFAVGLRRTVAAWDRRARPSRGIGLAGGVVGATGIRHPGGC